MSPERAAAQPIFFETPAELRGWLAQHHDTAREVWVGYYRKATGRPTMTWKESVDEALCFGWIDGIRKGIDETSYMNRFTPRKPGSNWSRINVENVARLVKEGRMQPAGLRAFEARQEAKTGQYSYENRPHEFEEPYLGRIKQDPAAWEAFWAQAPSYRRAAIWWVISAKQEATRLRRLEKLIEDSAAGRRIQQLVTPARRDRT